jgi:hypothetical protein
MKKILLLFLFCFAKVLVSAQDGLQEGTYIFKNVGKRLTENIKVIVQSNKYGDISYKYSYFSDTFKEKELLLVKEEVSRTETYNTEEGKMPIIQRTFQFPNDKTKFVFKCQKQKLTRINPDKSLSNFIISNKNNFSDLPVNDNITTSIYSPEFSSYLENYQNRIFKSPRTLDLSKLQENMQVIDMEKNDAKSFTESVHNDNTLIGTYSAVAAVELSKGTMCIIFHYVYRFGGDLMMKIVKAPGIATSENLFISKGKKVFFDNNTITIINGEGTLLNQKG